MRSYHYDSQKRIFTCSDHEEFSDSDGAAVEERLLSVIKHATDVSSSSQELVGAIEDWPSEYHLSPARHNLLRPFALNDTHRILELGSGCGAITRYLGESGARIVAVEGSLRRAHITRERCRDLDNVAVYCDNLYDFRSNEKFDFVTLIGVLEYARLFVQGEHPELTALRKARSFLGPGGTLILAIENQLGLKYFNGCAEDHTGIPYSGINDLYEDKGPVTFGRRILAQKLVDAGFPCQEFFFPFPDYKLTGLLLSEGALKEKRLNVADLLIHNSGRDYPETHHRAFAEDLAWRVAIDNGLLPDLANSFLVLAKAEESGQTKAQWLARTYSRGHRHPAYQVESTIEMDENFGLVVRKKKIHRDAPQREGRFRHVLGDSPYHLGRLLVRNIHMAMAREASLEELAAQFRPWLEFLRANATGNDKDGLYLPNDFVDCIPANLIISPEGKLQFFDAEWLAGEPIPLAWVAVRGILNSLADCIGNRKLKDISFRDLLLAILGQGGIQLAERDILLADACEHELDNQCSVDASRRRRLTEYVYDLFYQTFRLTGHIPELRRELAWHAAEIARMRSSISWRITKPIRFLAFLWRKVVK